MDYHCALIFLAVITCFNSCVPLKENPKYGFSNGIYKIKSQSGVRHAYVQVDADSVQANYNFLSNNPDSAILETIQLTGSPRPMSAYKYRFSKVSFDLDLLSIPLKFRPGTSALPNQLTSNLNGAVYLGRRIDVFYLNRRHKPLSGSNTIIDHYGLSFGLFTGLGTTAMNPWVTNNNINVEYDGAIIPVGITGLIAVNNLTFGIAVGVDELLSRDKKFWIYTGKPWIGLSVGLNLN